MLHAGLFEPDVAVDACPLVEPTFLKGGVGPYTDEVVAAVVHVLGDVVYLGGVSAGFGAHVEAVEPHLGVAEDAVEAEQDVPAEVFLTYGEDFTVPAYAGFGILPAHRLVAVRMAGGGVEAQRGHEVVRNAHFLPGAVVELGRVRAFVVDGIGLGEIVEIFGSAAEVFLRVGRVAEGEAPAFIEPFDAAFLCLQRGAREQKRRHNYKISMEFHTLQI